MPKIDPIIHRIIELLSAEQHALIEKQMGRLSTTIVYTFHDTLPSSWVQQEEPTQRCDVCEGLIMGVAPGEGVYLWTRGGELRHEIAPLCSSCAIVIGITALKNTEEDEEESS